MKKIKIIQHNSSSEFWNSSTRNVPTKKQPKETRLRGAAKPLKTSEAIDRVRGGLKRGY